jgi:predicted O-linked N-acetylglucosamine transferase (SPINDLY family)
VLTVLGTTFAGRVAASLLNAVGLSELIAPSLASYEALAASFARDSAALSQVKAKLEKNRHTHALFDTARFTRNLEAAFETIWKRYQHGEPPASVAIAPAESRR